MVKLSGTFFSSFRDIRRLIAFSATDGKDMVRQRGRGNAFWWG